MVDSVLGHVLGVGDEDGKETQRGRALKEQVKLPLRQVEKRPRVASGQRASRSGARRGRGPSRHGVLLTGACVSVRSEPLEPAQLSFPPGAL